jgi:hypothetical protein
MTLGGCRVHGWVAGMLFLPAACSLAIPLDDLSRGAGGGDPTATATSIASSSTSAEGGSGAGGDPGLPSNCAEPADCSPSNNDCIEVRCDEGRCAYQPLPANAPTASQVGGDCRQVVCREDGSQDTIAIQSDPYDDANPCTVDGCDDGTPTQVPVAEGAPCERGLCNAVGACVGCLLTSDCGLDLLCDQGTCVPMHCDDDFQSADETDVDCGGSCVGCGEGLACETGEDCLEGACGSGQICEAPSCEDDVANGDETDQDCGGTCPGCADGLGCVLPRDCASGVCTAGSCAEPTCLDGVPNGEETDGDCGGPDCPGCALGELCLLERDCASGICDEDGRCGDQCSDGVQNGSEIAIDCGGGVCPGCPEGTGCYCQQDCASGICCEVVAAAPPVLPATSKVCTSDSTSCGVTAPQCAMPK